MKIKWKVAERPTGPYASFQLRSWPSAESPSGKAIAHIYAVMVLEDGSEKSGGDRGISYTAELAKDITKNWTPATLYVNVADWKCKDYKSFTWKTMKARFTNVADAKAAVAKFYETHPDWLPKE